MENRASVMDGKSCFSHKMLVTFGSRCNRPFAAGVTLSNLSLKKSILWAIT